MDFPHPATKMPHFALPGTQVSTSARAEDVHVERRRREMPRPRELCNTNLGERSHPRLRARCSQIGNDGLMSQLAWQALQRLAAAPAQHPALYSGLYTSTRCSCGSATPSGPAEGFFSSQSWKWEASSDVFRAKHCLPWVIALGDVKGYKIC